MNTDAILAAFGGTKEIMGITGVNRQRVSHFRTQKHIPEHHIRVFIALKPELDWHSLLGSENIAVYQDLLKDRGIQNIRVARLRTEKVRVNDKD